MLGGPCYKYIPTYSIVGMRVLTVRNKDVLIIKKQLQGSTLPTLITCSVSNTLDFAASLMAI